MDQGNRAVHRAPAVVSARSQKWREFQRRYRQELRPHGDLLRRIGQRAARRNVTLVYGARDEVHNDAVVLAAAVRARMPRAASKARRARLGHARKS
jgi:uncharacterized protein YeaO (DUF488 family)